MTTSSRRIRYKWFLEGYVDATRVVQRTPLEPMPFTIGRRPDMHLVLNMGSISRFHAEFQASGGRLIVRDHHSRNGTFVNRRRIYGDTAVGPGDIMHFGSCEFRVRMEMEAADNGPDDEDTFIYDGSLPGNFAVGGREFMQLMERGSIRAMFQPIVCFADSKVLGYEALGRGTMPGAPSMPMELFTLAQSLGMSAELSTMFRHQAMISAALLPPQTEIFVNIHPEEFRNSQLLLSSIQQIAHDYPHLKLVVEIPEGLIIDLPTVQHIRTVLRELNFRLAYDDFGAGQARLVELADAPPDYLKFDRSLITGLATAPMSRQKMVEMLVKYANELGVVALAEGVETEADAVACRDIGFSCAQGFLYGSPMDVAQLYMQSGPPTQPEGFGRTSRPATPYR